MALVALGTVVVALGALALATRRTEAAAGALRALDPSSDDAPHPPLADAVERLRGAVDRHLSR